MSFTKTMDQLQKHLAPNEKINAKAYGTFEGEILGHEVLKKGVLVATQNRVIFFRRGLFGLTEEMHIIPYGKITVATFKKALMGEAIVIRSSGSTLQLKWITAGNAEHFVLTLNDRINQ